MIEIAAILSVLVRKWEDFIIITILLFVNALVDFWQENKALSALKVLKQKLAKKALVLRDGVWQEIEAKYLVPGDIIKIKIGDIVPADVKLLEGDFILVDQSALTGESLPVSKSKEDVVYSNSIVKQGEMIALVTATGLDTYFGKTVKLVTKAEKEERALQLSDIFWDYYEEIKNYREIIPRGLSENSLLQRAINNLKSILKLEAPDELNPLKPFVKTLIEDIFDYGTLSDYTLRRLANINIKKPENIISELTKLREELGEDYLEKEKQHLKSMEKEIIIAIENRKGV